MEAGRVADKDVDLIDQFYAVAELYFHAPASRNLAACGRWHAARDNADRAYLHVFRPLLAPGPRTSPDC